MSNFRAKNRPDSRPTPALEILLDDEQPAMASIIRRARWLETLGRHLHAHLPSPLNQHARLTNIQDDALVYLVDSPIWHTRLRLSSEILLNAARGIGLNVSSLRIRTARQPFDLHMRAMAEIDTRMRHENGTTATEARVLADMRVLIGEQSGEVGPICHDALISP